MSEDCLFKVVLGKCPHKEKLSRSQPDGARLRNIIDASIRYGDLLHVTLQEKLDSNENTQVYYHRHCISTYLTCAPSTSQSVDVQCPPHKRIRRSDIPVFKFREHCLYCGKICEVEKDYKHPKRWVPAYLVKEVDKNELDEMGKPVKAKDKIIAQCKVRADQWGEVVKARVMGSLSDLHASDARYHKDCLSRFSSNRNAPFDSNESHGDCIDETPQLAGVKQLIAEMRSDQTKIWDSAGLQERFVDIVGSPIKRVELVRMLSESADDLVILSAIGYRKIVMFRDNARATLKVTKADAEEEDIDSALDVISKAIKTEVVNIQCEKDTYKRGISKSVASDSVSPTLQVLLQKLTPKLDTDSLTSILVGNMVTSVMRSHATPLQIALGVLVHRKKIIKHLFDYNVTCSYDEMVRYKRSSAMARYKKMRREERSPVTVDGLIQHIVDNFDADMSSPNGKISTHALAMIECFPESDNTTENDSFPRISKLEMKNPIHFDDEEDELMPFIGGGNPLPPPTLPSSLSDEFREKQRVSYARAGDMDFEFLQVM